MSFAADIAKIKQRVLKRHKAVFNGVVAAAYESITVGSSITGAPGQPVDTGTLRNSWTVQREPGRARIVTNVEYAPFIEDPDHDVTFHNGGAHSVELTRLGISALLAAEVQKARESIND